MAWSMQGGQSTTKTKGSSNTNQTQQATASAAESQLNDMVTGQLQNVYPKTQDTQLSTLNFINNLLAGNSVGGLGTTQYGITEDQTRSMAKSAVSDALPAFQQFGALDSGAALEAASNVAGNVYNQNAQFNVQNALNMINSIFQGQYNAQLPIANAMGGMQSSLAGLRSINTTGTEDYNEVAKTRGFQASTSIM